MPSVFEHCWLGVRKNTRPVGLQISDEVLALLLSSDIAYEAQGAGVVIGLDLDLRPNDHRRLALGLNIEDHWP